MTHIPPIYGHSVQHDKLHTLVETTVPVTLATPEVPAPVRLDVSTSVYDALPGDTRLTMRSGNRVVAVAPDAIVQLASYLHEHSVQVQKVVDAHRAALAARGDDYGIEKTPATSQKVEH